jgi:2-oxoglutarate dehydrogenase E1 component
MEQLYPRPTDEVRAEIAKYPNLQEIRWVQDEPSNMGAWPHMALHLAPELDTTVPFRLVSRVASSAPSVGQKAQHLSEHADLVERAFG